MAMPGRLNTNDMVKQAVANQAANVLQKAMLDAVQTKMVLLLKEIAVTQTLDNSAITVGDALDQYQMHIQEMKRIVSLTRDECAKIRPNFEFPDEKVQAIISRAVDEITNVILEVH